MVRRHCTYPNTATRRPPVPAEVQALIVPLAVENPCSGYQRIKGRARSGSATECRRRRSDGVLRANGIDPAPRRAGRRSEEAFESGRQDRLVHFDIPRGKAEDAVGDRALLTPVPVDVQAATLEPERPGPVDSGVVRGGHGRARGDESCPVIAGPGERIDVDASSSSLVAEFRIVSSSTHTWARRGARTARAAARRRTSSSASPHNRPMSVATSASTAESTPATLKAASLPDAPTATRTSNGSTLTSVSRTVTLPPGRRDR